MSQTTRATFDTAPVVADVLDLLANHGPELRAAFHADERACMDAEKVLSMCGPCCGSGLMWNPASKRREQCWTCSGQGVR